MVIYVKKHELPQMAPLIITNRNSSKLKIICSYTRLFFISTTQSLTECFLFGTQKSRKAQNFQVAMPLLASGPSTLNDISHSLILSHANLATFRSLAKGKSKSRRERITSLALVGLAECFQPDGYIQAIAMYASAKVCVVCVRPKTFICVKPSLTECSLSFSHRSQKFTDFCALLRSRLASG